MSLRISGRFCMLAMLGSKTWCTNADLKERDCWGSNGARTRKECGHSHIKKMQFVLHLVKSMVYHRAGTSDWPSDLRAQRA